MAAFRGEAMTINNVAKPIDKGALILGTILSVPLFFVCFGVVAVVAYTVHTFLAGSMTDGVPRFVELSATVISSLLGVGAGRWVCDKAFKAWSGWPIFVLLILLALMNAYAISQGYGDGMWRNTLSVLQMIVACAASWFWIVKKLDF